MRALKATLALALSLTATTLGFAAGDPLMKETQGLFEPVPSEAPAFKDNPTSPAKVELGQMLYFDPRLSQSQHKLQHLSSNRTWRRRRLAYVDRP